MSEKVKPGVFAEGTTGQVRFALLDLLEKEGIPSEEADKIIRKVSPGSVFFQSSEQNLFL